jgi:hypothetical protein
MNYRNRWLRFAAAAVGCLVVAMSVDAVAPEIRDDAKMFSPAAVKKADTMIREIYRQHDRDVLIETFSSIPMADAEKVKAMDVVKRDAYFLQWAKDRVRDRLVNGIYVLICKEPHHLEVGVVEKQPHKFSPGTSDAIKSVLRKELKEGRYDEGLAQAMNVIESELVKKQAW